MEPIAIGLDCFTQLVAQGGVLSGISEKRIRDSTVRENKHKKMKTLIMILCLTCFAQYETFAQAEFELEPSQSMSITGKGLGQDATKNPYDGQNCVAIVENIGKREFSIRTQQNGKMIETIPITRGEIVRVNLPKEYELYLDTNAQGKAKAKVEFEKMTE
jgi:hypothetical protein